MSPHELARRGDPSARSLRPTRPGGDGPNTSGANVISPNGYSHGQHDVYVISRHQLYDLMALDGLRREHLTDPEITEELTARLAELRKQQSPTRSDPGKP